MESHRGGDNVVRLVGPVPRHAEGAPTFRELAEEWWGVESQRLAEPENEWRHIGHLRHLWEMTEAELRPRAVKLALAELRKTLSAATVNKVRGTGRRIIREAQVEERWAGLNPFEVVQRLRETRPVHRTLSLPEVRQLLPCLREDRRREALVMLYLGLRPGEWKALRKTDVDFRAGTLAVRRSNDRASTKTGKVRVVPIPEGLRPVLDEAVRLSPSASLLVFPAKDGGLQRYDAKLSRMLRAALRRAQLVSGWRYVCRRHGCGFEEERPTKALARCPRCNMKLWAEGVALAVRFYDLRHSCATLHREAGADPLAIQVALGHAPENLTDSIYTHLSMDYLRRELNKLRLG